MHCRWTITHEMPLLPTGVTGSPEALEDDSEQVWVPDHQSPLPQRSVPGMDLTHPLGHHGASTFPVLFLLILDTPLVVG